MDADIEALKRRNIKLEAYTGRENMRSYNVTEESEETTEEVVRNLFVNKDQSPSQDVMAIRFERVHRIPTTKAKHGSQHSPRPIIVRFSHYQDKEHVRSFVKNLKGSDIGISDDCPREVEDICKTLYPVLKKAKEEKRKSFLNFDKLIRQIYRGKETKKFPFYGNIRNKFPRSLNDYAHAWSHHILSTFEKGYQPRFVYLLIKVFFRRNFPFTCSSFYTSDSDFTMFR